MAKLIAVTNKEFDVILDLRYATANNVCSQKLYSKPLCYLAKDTIEPFKKAIELAKKSGYKIKIWDGFRPLEVQQFMRNRFPEDSPEGEFISDPKSGAIPHCRGVAIDLTLCDLAENEIEMGTDFDNFSNLANHDCSEVSKLAQKNRLILLEIMTAAGFDSFSKEWWHYQLFNARGFPILQAPQNITAI